MKKRLLLLALITMISKSSLFANFFTQNGGCCNPPPAYYKAGCCDKERYCRERIKGRPRWTCCDRPKYWSLRRWLFGEDCCKAQRAKKCCWPNQYKTCTPCEPTLERCGRGACAPSSSEPPCPIPCDTVSSVECSQPCETVVQHEDGSNLESDVTNEETYEDGQEYENVRESNYVEEEPSYVENE